MARIFHDHAQDRVTRARLAELGDRGPRVLGRQRREDWVAAGLPTEAGLLVSSSGLFRRSEAAGWRVDLFRRDLVG